MNKKFWVLLTTGGLVAVAAFALLTVSLGLPIAMSRYPGSVRAKGESVEFSFPRALLNRRAVYWTEDDLPAVMAWYAALLDVDRLSDGNMLAADDCVWITWAKQTYRFNHTMSVMMCSASSGTRIDVNESAYLWP